MTYGTVLVVVEGQSSEGGETSIAWEPEVLGMSCWLGIPATHIDGKVVTVVAVEAGTLAVLKERMVVAGGQMVETVMTKQYIEMSQVTRDWHKGPKVHLTLSMNYAAIVVGVEEHKKQDVEAEQGKGNSRMVSVAEASLVESTLSANSWTQMMPRWKVENEVVVVVEREAWYRPEGRVASRWTTVVAPLLALPASRAQNVSPK